jgi:hypothetical protein
VHTADVAAVGVAALAAVGVLAFVLIVLGLALPVLGLAILVPVLVAITRRPQFGVLVLVAFVPFDGLLEITNVPGALEAWKEVLVGVILVATFVCPVGARAPKGRRRPGWVPALVGLLLVGFASAAAARDIEAAVGLKINFFYILLAVAIWRCPLDRRERDRIVSILMATGIVCAVVGLGQQVVGSVRLNEMGYEYDTTIRFAGDFLRSFSTFESPFPFAFYEMLVLLVCVPIALNEPRRLRNRLFLFATPVLVLGMFSSVVRASALGLGVGLAYLGFRRSRVLLAGLPLGLVAMVVLGVLGGSVTETFSSGESFGQRKTGWDENFVAIARHPLGNGIGTTGAAAEKAIELGSRDELYNPDNYYFKTLYELGVLGLWMFGLFLIGAFVSTRRAADRSPRDGPLLDGFGAFILGAAAANLVANVFDAFPIDVDFWVLLAIVAAVSAATDDRDPELDDADEGAVVDV